MLAELNSVVVGKICCQASGRAGDGSRARIAVIDINQSTRSAYFSCACFNRDARARTGQEARAGSVKSQPRSRLVGDLVQ